MPMFSIKVSAVVQVRAEDEGHAKDIVADLFVDDRIHSYVLASNRVLDTREEV